MLTLLTLMTARAEEVPDLDALIHISTTPIIQHPLIEVEPRTESEAFRKALRIQNGRLLYCFESTLKSNPTLSGTLTVEMVIEEGRVSSVETTQDTLGDPTLTNCIEKKLQAWEFPAALSGEFTLPFTCGVGSED